MLFQQGQTLSQGRQHGAFSFEFQGNVTTVACCVHDAGDAGVVQVQSIPNAATLVGFGLEQYGLGGELGEAVVGVFEEVSGIEGDLEPWGFQGIYDLEHAFRGSAQPPVIFQSHDDTTFFGFGDELGVGVRNPAEGVVHRVAGQGFFGSAVSHEIVEILPCAPSAGIDADGGDAQLIGFLEIADGLVDVFLAFGFIRGDKSLVGGIAHEVEPQNESAALGLPQGGRRPVLPLPLQDFHSVKAEVRCGFEAFGDGAPLLALEAPE